MSKRKCTFNNDLKKKFPSFKQGKESWEALCTVCNSTISIASKGRLDLEDHIKTGKHKKNLESASQSSRLDNFFVTGSQTKLLRAAEGTLAYHIVNHHLSYRSSDCSMALNKTIFNDSTIAKNVTCGRTKVEAIVNNVLAPHSEELVLQSLSNVSCFGVATDASNHGSTKLFPIVVQYFDHKNGGIQSKILDLQSATNEKSDTITNIIFDVLDKRNIISKCVAFAGDNCNTNFGGINRPEGNNVYSNLKTKISAGLVGVGCPAHVINNTIHHGTDVLPFDIDCIVLKIYQHFAIYTVRTESLKDFGDSVDTEYQELLSYSKTRWLSLFPAIERILKLFEPLKAYFMSLRNTPALLLSFFGNEFSEAYLWLAHSLMSIFHKNIATLEKSENSLIEIMEILENVFNSLKDRHEQRFIPVKVKQLLAKNRRNGLNTMCNEFEEVVQKLYNTCIEYVAQWMTPFEEFSCFKWMSLAEAPTWDLVLPSVEYVQEKGVEIDDSKLFDQLGNLRKFVQQDLSDDNRGPQVANAIWVKYFKQCVSSEQYTELIKLVEFFFAIPAHNANLERIFSLVQAQWTKERNRLLVDNIKHIIQVKYNFTCKCDQFYEYLLSKDKLLHMIGDSSKYTATDMSS